MNKSILVGGGAGLLVLALLAAFWFSARAPEPPLPASQNAAPGVVTTPSATAPTTAVAPGSAPLTAPRLSPSATSSADGGAPFAPSDSSLKVPGSARQDESKSTAEKKPLTKEERRAIRSQVRAKMSELLAKGQSVTAADTQAFINDVEQLGQGMFDPRYFSTLREMAGYSAQTQALSQELSKVASSKDSKDVQRQQEILAEMRDLGDRISNGAAALQSYARDAIPDETP